mmetsp:Transcript_52753/g.150338  ORF Transcript_52753/g.150338 Transcript_52753/m.150338 type:complete len:281 (-) Transcript_52753:848-1690(-)
MCVHHLVRREVHGYEAGLVEYEHQHERHREALNQQNEGQERVACENTEDPAPKALVCDQRARHAPEEVDVADLSRPLHQRKAHELPVVVLANGAIQPDAPVVKLLHTRSSLGAVLCAQVLQHPCSRAKPRNVRWVPLCAVAVEGAHELFYPRVALVPRRQLARILERNPEEEGHGQRHTHLEQHGRGRSDLVARVTQVHEVLEECQGDADQPEDGERLLRRLVLAGLHQRLHQSLALLLFAVRLGGQWLNLRVVAELHVETVALVPCALLREPLEQGVHR